MMEHTGSPKTQTAGELAAIIGLAVVLALAGVVDGVDSIVWYVLAITDGVAADPLSLLKPIYNPPPMYTHAYRPLSTALVKLGQAAFGLEPAGLRAWTFAHGLLLAPYGLAARASLRAHGHTRWVALGGALLAMVAPTVLFSAWTLPEFDMLGGAFVLGATWALLRRRWWVAAPLMALALLTKETSAVFLLAWLLAWASVGLRRGDRAPLWATVGFSLALVAAVAPILTVEPPVTHAFTVADPRFDAHRGLFLAFHDVVQLFVSVGAAGAALVLLAATSGRVRVPGGLALGLALATVAPAPILHALNHYESMVMSDWPWVLGWCLVLVGGLIGVARRRADGARIEARFVLIALAGLLAGPMLTGFSRADLSARLFAPALPVVFAVALMGARGAWRRGGADRLGAAVLGASLLWAPLAGGFNAWQAHQARFSAETPGKAALAAALHDEAAGDCPLVLETHRDHELAVEELTRLADLPGPSAPCLSVVRLAEVSTQPGATVALHGYDQHRQPQAHRGLTAALSAGAPPPSPTHLWMQGPRAGFSAPTGERPADALAWAARRMPDIRSGAIEQGPGVAHTAETALERLFRQAGGPPTRFEAPFVQVPVWLGEVPRRLWVGWPLVERWTYRAAHTRLAPAASPAASPAEAPSTGR